MVFPITLPKPESIFPFAAKGLQMIPASFHSEAIAHIINHLLKGQWAREQLAELDGKRIAIHVRDANTEVRFEVVGHRLIRGATGSVPDVTIEGDLRDFWLLATRAEDPDTLFFHRRLALKGDVATGLLVKNWLDALDYDTDAHLRAVLGEKAGSMASEAVAQVRRAAGAWKRQP